MPSSAPDTFVEIKITLGNGKEVKPFNSVTITQSVVEHHTFEVRCYHTVLENDAAQVINATQNLVGQDISIMMKKGGSSSENIFKGIITDIGMAQGDGLHHEIILKGYSSTIKLEGGPKLKTFNEMNASDIIQKIMSANGMHGSFKINSDVFPYCTQFNESDYQFIRRLAALHGAWFYYDGTKLVIGEPSTLATVKLQYMRDLMTLSMGMGTLPLNFTTSTYDSEKAVINTTNSPSPSGTDSYGSKMFSAAKSLYPSKFKFMARQVANSTGGLETFTKSYLESLAAGMVYVQASGDNPEVAIAKLAEIKTQAGDSYGKFLITSVVHHADGMGHYTNNFTGIPSTLKSIPNPYFHKPNADFEMAKVIDNADPDNLGRVRVKFIWMDDTERTAWIRTTQIYGGEGGTNRGIIFTPEIGDDVIVGFERGDCDKPYVAHSLMNSKALKIEDRDNKDNLKKTISTRNSNITFHDEGGGNPMGIKINVYGTESKPIALIHMLDDGGKKLDMSAVDEVYISTDNDDTIIQMKKDGTINVKGKNITIEASDKFHVKAKDILMEAQSTIKEKANSGVTIEAGSNIELKAQANFTVKANAKASVESSGQMELKALQISVKASAMLDLDGGGLSNLKGGVVMIN